MRGEIVEQVIVWSCIILSLAAYISLIVMGNSGLGIAGLVISSLPALAIFLVGKV